MRTPSRVLALVVFALVAIDLIWALRIGFRVEGIGIQALKIAAIWAAGEAYLWLRPNPRLSEMLTYVVLWLVFSVSAAVLTYLAAGIAMPFQDAIFGSADAWLGLNARGFTGWLEHIPWLWHALQADYYSLIVQISCTVLWLAHTRTPRRNAEFLCAAIISFAICCAISALLPALGPSPAQDPSLAGPPAYVAEILAMRGHGKVSRSVEALQGIITFPSYHTVLALLLIWAHRGLRSLPLVLLADGAMLLGVPGMGNHYVSDMVAGAVLAVGAVVCAQWFVRGAVGGMQGEDSARGA